MSDLIKDIENLRKKCDERKTEIANVNAKIELLTKQKAELEKQLMDQFGIEVAGLSDMAEKLEEKALKLKKDAERSLGI